MQEKKPLVVKQPRKGHSYERADIDRIIEMGQDGKSPMAISRETGIGYQTVQKYLRTYGVYPRPGGLTKKEQEVQTIDKTYVMELEKKTEVLAQEAATNAHLVEQIAMNLGMTILKHSKGTDLAQVMNLLLNGKSKV